MKKGVVYTPRYWADWAVATCRISERWMNGAVILDPGCGQGSLIEAVIRIALDSGFSPERKDLTRLIGIERDSAALEICRKNIREKYQLELPAESLIHGDYLLRDYFIKADLVFSNPPWVSFGDLDDSDKKQYKPVFRESGLTPDPRSLLLGGSRIDLAALFVAVALNRDTAEGGEGHFFLPTSLFRGEGAHSAFRRLNLPGGRKFVLTKIRELDNGIPFPGAGTRYCFASYKADRKQYWPIPWLTADNSGGWHEFFARPVDGDGSPLITYKTGSPPVSPPRIPVPRNTVPRQGVNCGGGSEAYLIEKTGKVSDGMVAVANKKGTCGILPAEMVYPLMSPSCFSETEGVGKPERWIFLPYNKNGKVLSADDIENYPGARDWLEKHRALLVHRKGTMLKRYGNQGVYWALLGVGPYTFAPWKLAWESYGRNRFVPKLFNSEEGEIWQGNQALHAYIPFYDQKVARRAFKVFSSPAIDDYLRNLGGASTKNWAQPGRIRRLLDWQD